MEILSPNTKTVSIRVPGDPVGKGRPRFVRGSGRTYTPEKTANYENLVRLTFTQKYPDFVPIDSEMIIFVRAYFRIPESWSKKKKEEALKGKVPKTTKPDLDNIIKSVSDGLNGTAWTDDAKLTSIIASKYYGSVPFVEVTIYYSEEEGDEGQ